MKAIDSKNMIIREWSEEDEPEKVFESKKIFLFSNFKPITSTAFPKASQDL
ncbi:MAG: hypothetical protein QXT53_04785 [Ignisphaera sp.]